MFNYFSRKEVVEADREAMKEWFDVVLHQMDLVDLRCKAHRQLKAPKTPTLVDDLGRIYEFPPFLEQVTWNVAMKHAHSILSRTALQNPDMEAFKAEVGEELAAQRKKQEETTAIHKALEAKLDTSLAKQDKMASDIKSLLTLIRTRNPWIFFTPLLFSFCTSVVIYLYYT